MLDALTPRQSLAEEILKRSLAEYLTEKRDQERPRWSLKQIADQLSDDTDGKVAVSAEAIRQWFAIIDADEAVA